ncbi:MAG: NAD(P)/FAD-dependent oxidoreductase [Phenylobacterium sp.]|nr:NAD(P)/FAD-dependent oxidoreductase [Phenylobacterium sp.]
MPFDTFSLPAATHEFDVIVVGSGFGGLFALQRLRAQGLRVRVYEAGDDVGGTWYWNRYPGAQCDIESYCYLPLLEELGYVPKEKYSYVNEIFEHSQRVGRHYRLYESACFQTRVRELRWDEGLKRWRITTNRGDDMKARFVIMALGTASRAKLPGIPGIETFEGHTFHTSRWDYDYTGGDTTGNLTKLADKRVAVIGTGATAIQCVPYVGRHAQHLYVFQRTPSSVDLRGNKPTDPDWAKTLEPGWQRARRKNFANIVEGKPFTEDLVNDGWTDIFRSLASGGALAEKLGIKADPLAAVELADFVKMNRIRARVDATVKTPEAAEALKPWYRQFCKRPTFNDEYLPTFNRPNVTLVDVSASQGVERITPAGVVANGTEYPVDCIIYASGFEISTAFRRRIGFEIYGRDGLSLYDYYKDGFRTLHGHSSRGFPNWFYIGVGQNGLSVNMTAMFDDQAQHIAYIIKETRARGATTVEPTAEAEEAWVETIRSVAILNRDFQNACTPGYYNNEGGERSGGLNGQTYTPGINKFNALLAQWREQGDLEGLELRQA